MPRSTDELRAELREAEERERQEQKERQRETPIKWKFTLTRVEVTYQELYSDDYCLYRLAGEVANREEAEAAGHHSFDMKEGGINIVFNHPTQTLITTVGGGTIWVSGPDARRTMKELSRFLMENPEGGDVTSIVEEHRRRRQP